MNTKWIMGVLGVLIASGVMGAWSLSSDAHAAEVRVRALEDEVKEHREAFTQILPLLSEIKEQIRGVNWRLDKLETATEKRRK